ncbi:MAG: UDP-3-O-(3-hydroxymyristoyl)glucosamine N-acyltransferase [Pseudomonadota bacterium]|jgi:UDP-3-O-[3-hydroxymyristoyl] glucosamine N-acyltransferase
MHAKRYTLGELAELLDARLEGDADALIDGLASLREAGPGKLSFLSNPAYVSQLPDCRASAIIIEARFAPDCPASKLISNKPYVAFARATRLFDNRPMGMSGIHGSAVIDPGAVLGPDVAIGPHVVIGAGVHIGSGSRIEAGCVVGEGCVLGDGVYLHANVTLYHNVTLGKRVEVHSGAVLGADGFGFAFDGKASVKIAQLGAVVIGDDVEIGAGTTIDRGALEDTVIGEGVKIDNQVQIGHNVRVGRHTVICGCTAIAGSASIGEYCVLGGASGMVGHISIANGVRISAMSLVSQPITEPGTYSSGTGLTDTATWKKNIVRFRQLDGLAKRVRELERLLAQSDSSDE